MDVLEHTSSVVGYVGVAVIVWGALKGLMAYLRGELSRFRSRQGLLPLGVLQQVRYCVGFHLLLGLEFLVAADVVRTIAEPTLEELAILGGTVAIRTVISYFLNKEIAQAEK